MLYGTEYGHTSPDNEYYTKTCILLVIRLYSCIVIVLSSLYESTLTPALAEHGLHSHTQHNLITSCNSPILT